MNTIKRNIAALRGRLSDSICHIGWGFMGQECDCGQVWPNMNWLARRAIKWGVDDWGEDDRLKTRRARICFAIGDKLYGWGTALINGPLMQEYYADERARQMRLFSEAVSSGEVKLIEHKPRKPYVRVTEGMAQVMYETWLEGRNYTFIANVFGVDPKTAKRHILRKSWEHRALQNRGGGGIDDAMSILSSRGGRA